MYKALGIVSGLQYLHDLGVVHAEIKSVCGTGIFHPCRLTALPIDSRIISS